MNDVQLFCGIDCNINSLNLIYHNAVENIRNYIEIIRKHSNTFYCR